jgi:hypothetical protein
MLALAVTELVVLKISSLMVFELLVKYTLA